MRGIFVFSMTAAVLGITSIASAVFFDNFDVDTSASWTVNKGGGNNANNIATFAYDYSAMGIASAPGASGGTTKGLRLEANIAGSILSGLSVSPTGLSVNNDFVMTADVWLNFFGPAPGGGSGTTQFAGMGWGTSGTTAQWSSSVQDSVHFSTSLDGGSASDYRAYSSAAPTSYASGNAVYAAPAGAINNTNAYYTTAFAPQAIPGAQTSLFASQTGSTAAGTTGFKWRQWRIEKAGNSLTWRIDGTLLATVDLTTVTTAAAKNILINMFDSNSGSSVGDVNHMNTMIVDNVQVVPEPATMTALALGIGALLRRRRK